MFYKQLVDPLSALVENYIQLPLSARFRRRNIMRNVPRVGKIGPINVGDSKEFDTVVIRLSKF